MQNPHVFTLRALIFLELASSVYPHRVVGRRVWGRVPQNYVSVIPKPKHNILRYIVDITRLPDPSSLPWFAFRI